MVCPFSKDYTFSPCNLKLTLEEIDIIIIYLIPFVSAVTMICVCLTLGPKHGLHLWAMESLIHGDHGSSMKKFLGICKNNDSAIFVR